MALQPRREGRALRNLGGGEDRVEALRVQVEERDGVPLQLRGAGGRSGERVVEGSRVGVGEDDEDFHGSSSGRRGRRLREPLAIHMPAAAPAAASA